MVGDRQEGEGKASENWGSVVKERHQIWTKWPHKISTDLQNGPQGPAQRTLMVEAVRAECMISGPFKFKVTQLLVD